MLLAAALAGAGFADGLAVGSEARGVGAGAGAGTGVPRRSAAGRAASRRPRGGSDGTPAPLRVVGVSVGVDEGGSGAGAGVGASELVGAADRDEAPRAAIGRLEIPGDEVVLVDREVAAGRATGALGTVGAGVDAGGVRVGACTFAVGATGA